MAAAGVTDAQLADRIELLVAHHPGEPFSFPRITKLAGDLWDAQELNVSYALSVMRERLQLLSQRYPYEVGKQHVAFRGAGDAYLVLLGLSNANWLNQQARQQVLVDIEKFFERFVQQALGGFFGEDTCTLNFGWPSEIGRPQEFPRAVAWLAEQVGIPAGSAYRQPRRKDGGVDVVVWRNFGDRRPGVPIMLVQATVQDDFVGKVRDIDRRLWAGWLSMDTDPIVALAVPHVSNDLELWREVAINGLLLDRIRLTRLSPEGQSVNADYAKFLLEVNQAVRIQLDR